MAIEKTTLVRRPSSPPPPRVDATLGGLLRRRKVEVLGPITEGKMNGLNILPQVASRLERVLAPVKYFALAKGTNISDLIKALRSEDLGKFTVRGRLFLCLGEPSAIFPPLERSLKDFKDAFKGKKFISAAEAGLKALAVVEGEDRRPAVVQELLTRLKGGLNELAEQYVQLRNPREITSLFLELADRELNLEMLTRLARLSDNELKVDQSDRQSPAFKKLLKKEGIRPLLLEAFDKWYPLESEAEFALKMAEAFPSEVAYIRQLIDLELKAGDLKDAQEHIRGLRESGKMDLELWQRADRLRGLLIAEEMAKHPDQKIFLERSFEKLVSGKMTAGEYEAVKLIDIGLEYFIEEGLKLFAIKRWTAYRTICRLSEIVENGEEGRVNQLKQGMFGHMLQDAIDENKLTKEEEDLLQDFTALYAYRAFNPARAREFAGQIRDKLLRAQKSRDRSANEKILKMVYKFLVLEPDFEGDSKPLEIERGEEEEQNGADQPKKNIILDDEQLPRLGWGIIDIGEPEQAIDLAYVYSKSCTGLAGYEIAVAALAELGQFETAAKMFATARPVLDPVKAERFERMIAQKKTYAQVEADDNLRYVIIEGNKTVEVKGRRYRLGKFDETRLNQTLAIAIINQKARSYIFEQFKMIFLAQAQSLEGAPVVTGFLAGALLEKQAKPEAFSPISEEFMALFRVLNLALIETFSRDPLIAREVIKGPIKAYTLTLQAQKLDQELDAINRSLGQH